MQRLAGEELGVDHALQGRGEDGGRDSFAGDVGEDEGEIFVIGDDVEEVASDLFARDGTGGDAGVGEVGDFDRHEILLDAGGDVEFFAVAAGVFFGDGELGVVDEGGGLGGDGLEEIVIDLGELAGVEAAVEIEDAEDFAMGGAVGFARLANLLGAATAKRDADDGADALGDHAVGARAGFGGEGVGDHVFAGGAGGLLDGGAGEGEVVGEDFAGAATSAGEVKRAGFVDEEDVAAFDLSELEGGFDERGEYLVDGADGVELAGGLEEPAEFFEIGIGRGDGLDLAEQVANGGMADAALSIEAEDGAFERSEMERVIRIEALFLDANSVNVGAVATFLVYHEEGTGFEGDFGVFSGDVGMGEDEVAVGEAADGEGTAGHGAGGLDRTIEENERDFWLFRSQGLALRVG